MVGVTVVVVALGDGHVFSFSLKLTKPSCIVSD